jgi:hypothetical protein
MLDPRTSLCLLPALLLILSGCSQAPVPAKPQRTTHLRPRPHPSASTPLTPVAAEPLAPLPSPSAPAPGSPGPVSPGPASPAPGSPGSIAPAVVPPAAPPAAAPPSNPAPLQLVGLSQSEVRRLLGPPTTSSTKGAAVAWIYQHAGCTVEIAFYYDVTRNGFFALSQRSLGGGEAQACLANAHDNHAS